MQLMLESTVRTHDMHPRLHDVGAQRPVAEFFAGIGLVRKALEQEGFAVVFANDVEPAKREIYAANFGASDFILGDVRAIRGSDVPQVVLATASFPCTDLSLAGWRRGFQGGESSLFWEFARVLREMATRKPPAVLVENVPSFATSHGGKDLRAAIEELNGLGYSCDLVVVDARHFVPQSRPRLFIVGSLGNIGWPACLAPTEVRPPWLVRFLRAHPELRIHTAPLPRLPKSELSLGSIVHRLNSGDAAWWNGPRLDRFIDSLSAVQASRLTEMRVREGQIWATAYRRTRGGKAVWEIRADAISGCLRAVRGGSSKQAVIEAGDGELRIRWMLPEEYGSLQGAPGFKLGQATPSQALFGFGDAVCVPVIAWLARNYLRPLISGRVTASGGGTLDDTFAT